jgi:hypothetical protein
MTLTPIDMPGITSSSALAEAATDWQSAAALGIILLVTVWGTILGHEAAHFGIARLVYRPADLAANRVPTGPHIATVAAGPVFTLLTVAIGVAMMPVVRTSRGRAIVSGVIGSAASRILLIAPPTLLGHGGNDERTLGDVTGISARLLLGVEVLLIAWAILTIYYGGDFIGEYFTDLASNWRGWDGERSWRSLEDALEFHASMSKPGAVFLRVVLRNSADFTWTLTHELRIENGDLDTLARQACAFGLALGAAP